MTTGYTGRQHWLHDEEKRLDIIGEVVYRMLSDPGFKSTPFENLLKATKPKRSTLSSLDKANIEVSKEKLKFIVSQVEKDLIGRKIPLDDQGLWGPFVKSVLNSYIHFKEKYKGQF